jgi:hypothetical protein
MKGQCLLILYKKLHNSEGQRKKKILKQKGHQEYFTLKHIQAFMPVKVKDQIKTKFAKPEVFKVNVSQMLIIYVSTHYICAIFFYKCSFASLLGCIWS